MKRTRVKEDEPFLIKWVRKSLPIQDSLGTPLFFGSCFGGLLDVRANKKKEEDVVEHTGLADFYVCEVRR